MADAPVWCQKLVKVGIVVWVIVGIVGFATLDFNLIDPVIQMGVLLAIVLPIARRIARNDRDPALFGFIVAAFTAKMLGAVTRDLVTNVYYNGVADANEYHAWGKELVSSYRVFDFSPDIGKFSGTGFMRGLTGVIYSVAGTSKFGGFMIFSFFAFIGLLMFWRAFCHAVPGGDKRRYGLLVLFLPSLLYWPSALGKDAWSVMGLGIASFGVALILTRHPFKGALAMAIGLGSVTYVRPHVALVVFCGLVLAALVGRSKSRSAGAPIIRVFVFGALFVIGTVLASQTSAFLGVESLNAETVDAELSSAEGRTDEAGSTFTPIRVNTPLDLPPATVTVLFRPFPWEAHNGPAMGTSIEGVFLMWLTWRSRRRLLNIPRFMRREPYVAYCIGYLFVFIFAFSAFSNFGILARQRAQVMPAFLVMLCLPERRRASDKRLDASTVEPSQASLYPTSTRDDPYAALSDEPVNPYADPPDDG